MKETKEEKHLAQREEIVQRLNGMDDMFFQKLAESREVYEEMLRIILDKTDISLTKVETQKYLRNCGSRSVILDVMGEDAQRHYYCMEMEKSDKHDHPKRVRYNLSNVDTLVTEKGLEFKDLPEIYSIYVTKRDIYGKRKTKYRTPRVVDGDGQVVNDGVHTIYVNAQVDDGTACAELMQYLKNTDLSEDHPAFPKTVARVRYLKTQQRGQEEMCKLVEDYAREVAAEEVEKAMAEAEREKEKAMAEAVREKEKAMADAVREKEAARKTVLNMFRHGATMEFVSACVERYSGEELRKLEMEALG